MVRRRHLALYSQRQELKVRSIRRKLGALRQSIEVALRVRLRHKDQVSPKKVEQLRVVESELRQASGRLEELKKTARSAASNLEYAGAQIIRIAAATLVEAWSVQDAGEEATSGIVRNAVTRAVEEQTETLRRRMDALAQKLHETLRAAAKVLEIEDVPTEQEFASVMREMPAFDPGEFAIRVAKPIFLSLFGGRAVRSVLTKRLAGMVGAQLARSLSAYRALLYEWSDRTLGQMQRRFDAYANSYRAQVERLVGDHVSPAEQEGTIQRDLESLESARPEQTVTS